MAPGERAMPAARVAWWLVCAAWAASVGGERAAEVCSDGAAFHSLVASANASGYWSATLHLQKDARVPHRADAVRLDVHPRATLCGDTRTVAMTVELRGSSPVTFVATTASPDAPSRAAIPPAELGYARAPTFPNFYKVHQERVNWREAKVACEAEGAHLVIVESKEEAQAVAFLLRARTQDLTRTLHAGFFATNTDYFTVFGEPLNDLQYQRWAAGEPRHVDICGAVDHAGALLDAFCSWNVRRSFVCEYGGPPLASRGARRAVHQPRPSSQPPPAAATAAAALPYTRLPGAGSFQVRTENASWAEALAACERGGGHLAVVEAEAEAHALRQHLHAHRAVVTPAPQFHVGLFAESRFVTVFGDDLSDSEYQGWAQGEPNNHPCVVGNQDLTFATVGCALKTAFICEEAV